MNIGLGLFLLVAFVILTAVALLNDSPPHNRAIRVK
jgi:hypothetical protein